MKILVKKALALLDDRDADRLADFVAAFARAIPSGDEDSVTPASLVETARTHWALASRRGTGHPAIGIRTVHAGGKTGEAATAIDIVNDDMPFLVASLAAELGSQDKPIRTLWHPILTARRNAKGALASIDARTTTTAIKTERRKKPNGKQPDPAGDAPPQSHIHIELPGVLTDDQKGRLALRLGAVLDDVRAATGDWQAMRTRLRACHEGLAHAPSSPETIAESEAFLDYLYDDNFTLLGSCAWRNGRRGPEMVAGSGLGLMAQGGQDAVFDQIHAGDRDLPPVVVAKLDRRSTVHRAVPIDAIAVKSYDEHGNVTGETVFIGLFTSVTYSRSLHDVPYLRRKADKVMAAAGFAPGTHDSKALRHILEKYPRDELFQIADEALLDTALGILQVQERHRIALFMRRDAAGKYISCLVYVPRNRFDTTLRESIRSILEGELNGVCGSFNSTLDDSPLARLTYLVYTDGDGPVPDRRAIERKLQDAGRTFGEKLHDALRASYADEDAVDALFQRYERAFPVAYGARYEPRQTIYDIEKMEAVTAAAPFALDLYQDRSCSEDELRLKIYHHGAPVVLSDALPVLENLGLRVISELPYEVVPHGGDGPVWIHDFLLRHDHIANFDLASVKPPFEAALAGLWRGAIENDLLNGLVVRAGLDWRVVQILRACVRYLRQAAFPFTTVYIERVLNQHADVAAELAALFVARHDPAASRGRDAAVARLSSAIAARLDAVSSPDADRILRALLLLVQSSLRTNAFQRDLNGQAKSYLSIKFDSQALDFLPAPRPFREIFVYSTRMEGIHLRMDWISRGGIRWSDRPEDFRTEILGLMKAQQVKNAVIVPMGSKGGFILKQPPKTGGREAFQREGVECYKILIRGLLDLTDNRKGNKIVYPADVVRHDADDPYLVVAADKGTATFSDIANGLSLEYGFWLGDAFASGGSAGYDHKKMGITARGAWESVKRHFREMGVDSQTDAFDCVGVGDMAGDVFGNGMLLSPSLRLVGAFNHVHIFCDPDPDAASGFAERRRLFDEVKGWDHYDTALLSKGGRIYDRAEKVLQLTPEIMARFDMTQDRVAPATLIQAMLRARTNLLFFGGIGTYIKASNQSHADVNDRANDALRVDAADIRADVIGEGANLAITQLARVELAQGGRRLNTDFIDNSAGVDTSDHEVNIKILLATAVEGGRLTIRKRDTLLRSMTEEVAALVLRDNYEQTQGISFALYRPAKYLPIHAGFIRDLERHSGLNRKLEGLPDEDTIQRRADAGLGLTRPELSVLLAYAKILFTKDLLATEIPDNRDLEPWLFDYFPVPLRKAYADDIRQHRLRREIVATALANDLVNRMGPTFVKSMMSEANASCADVARAWLVVREAFGLEELWAEIEALDARVPAGAQLLAMTDIARLARRGVAWFLTRAETVPDISRDIAAYGPGVALLRQNLQSYATEDLRDLTERRQAAYEADGLPGPLAARLALLQPMAAAPDIIRIARGARQDVALTANTYFAFGAYLHLDWIRHKAGSIPVKDRWSTEALYSLLDQLNVAQADLTAQALRVAATGRRAKAESPFAAWTAAHEAAILHFTGSIAEMQKTGAIDLAMLMMAERLVRRLTDA